MGENISQTYHQKELNNLIALFKVYQKDIQKIRQAREYLNTPSDLSIDLAPVDLDDEDSFLQAIRNYENAFIKENKILLSLV